MPKNKTYWIIVADGARARILSNDGPGSGLRNTRGSDFESANRKNQEIVSDRSGSSQGASGGTHAMEPRVDWHRYEKHLFAKEMANRVNAAALHGEFDELVLVAPPQTLGELRNSLDKMALSKVRGELGKDLTKVSIHDLPKHLEDVINL